MRLSCHQQCCSGIPNQRVSENGPAAQPIGNRREQQGTDKQTEEGREAEGGKIGQPEKAAAVFVKNSNVNQQWCDQARQGRFIDLEYSTERNPLNSRPKRARRWQTIDACRDDC